MIEVSVSENHLSVIGHANYDKRGKDIVCAGVSALMYTLVQSLESFCAEEDITLTEGDGMTIIEYRDLSEQAKLLIDAFFIGILGIINSYPEYVKLAP